MSTQTYRDGTLIEEWDDDTRTYTNHETGDTRPYTVSENHAADQATELSARLDGLEDRLAALEAFVYGNPPPPTDPDGVKDWGAWGGIVPPQQLLLDVDGHVYRNVAGVPLTTPPSGMPGGPGPWPHLWLFELEGGGGDPEPGVDPFEVGKLNHPGDLVLFNGQVYKSVYASPHVWSPNEYPPAWELQPATLPGAPS